jgi:Raf kinase inhibitor-like YbhB/YbcL family protein
MRGSLLLTVTTTLALALGAVACTTSDDAASGSSGTSGGSSGTSGGSSGTSGGSSGSSGSSGLDGSSGGSGLDGGADAATASDADTDAGADAAAATFTLTSSAFAAGAVIPALHTCNGVNVSPALSWSGAPAGTQSYAIVMRDLSLGNDTNYHWVIYDIPAATTSLAQGVAKAAAPAVPAGAKQTNWSFGASVGYSGPCPPALHDYRFSVYSFATATIAVPGGTTDPAAADAILQAAKTGGASLDGKYEQ